MPNISGFDILLRFLHVLVLRKKFIFFVALVPTVVCIFVVFLMDSTYKAASLIKPPTSDNSSSIEAALKGSSGIGGGLLGSFLGGSETGEDDCMSILKSARFAKLIIDRFDLETLYKFRHKKRFYLADVIKRFTHNAKFELTDEDEINIAMEDKSPERAKEMVAYMVYTLDSLYTNIQRTANQRKLNYIDDRLHLAESDMKTMEDSMVKFQIAHNLIVPESQVKLILENATQTEIEIETLQEEISLEAALRGTSSARYKDLSVQKELLQHTLRGQLRNPSDSNELFLPARTLPTLATQYFRLERAYEIKLAVYKFLVQQVEFLKLEANKNVQVISILDPPWINDKRVSPARRVWVEAVFILSFIFAGVLAVVLDVWERHQKENPETRNLVAEIKRNLFKF